MLLRKWRAISASLLVTWTMASGCAQTEARLGDEPPEAGPPSTGFTPPPGTPGADAGPDATEIKALMCIGTVCPAPFATCAAESGPTYKCGTDLSHDPNNCGSCGNKCITYDPIALSSRCVDGACELECLNKPGAVTQWRNCNGAVDDGCEVDVYADAKNCGACGNACAAGSSCFKGKCGCPSGQIECPGPNGPECVNPKVDDGNCGGCGVVCDFQGGACSPLPKHAYYGCAAGTCGHLKCGTYTADCNNDLSNTTCKTSDGCEVEDLTTDKNNCGGCGIKCLGAEECVNEGNGFECAVPCARFGKSKCPNANPTCTDLLTDVFNCGGCNNACPNAGPNQVRSCNKGICAYACATGFADCNGNSADGCETNLLTHAGNCGSCGNACDAAAGQPCVEGKCLMTECDAGVTK